MTDEAPLTVRLDVSPDERAAVLQAAHRAGVSMTRLVFQIVREASDPAAEVPPRAVPLPEGEKRCRIRLDVNATDVIPLRVAAARAGRSALSKFARDAVVAHITGLQKKPEKSKKK